MVVNDIVSLEVLLSAFLVYDGPFREAAKGQPDLVFVGKATVLFKPVLIDFNVFSLVLLAHLSPHVISEMLGKADEVCATFSSLLDEIADFIIVVLPVLRGAHLDYTDHVSEHVAASTFLSG